MRQPRVEGPCGKLDHWSARRGGRHSLVLAGDGRPLARRGALGAGRRSRGRVSSSAEIAAPLRPPPRPRLRPRCRRPPAVRPALARTSPPLVDRPMAGQPTAPGLLGRPLPVDATEVDGHRVGDRRRRRELAAGVRRSDHHDVQRRLEFAAQRRPDVGERPVLRWRQGDRQRHRQARCRPAAR